MFDHIQIILYFKYINIIIFNVLNPLLYVCVVLSESSEGDFCKDLRELLLQLPDIHYSLLHYLCHFLSQVEQEHAHNRMTASNLATVFGPNVFQ